MATPQPQTFIPSVPAQMVDAVHSATSGVDALQALKDLMMVQGDTSREDLAHVDRNSLAYLLSIVTTEISKDLQRAIAVYEAGLVINRQKAN
jgi:hypothetical protein